MFSTVKYAANIPIEPNTWVLVSSEIVPRKTLRKLRETKETEKYELNDEPLTYRELADILKLLGGEVTFAADIHCNGLKYSYEIEEVKLEAKGLVLYASLYPGYNNRKKSLREPAYIHVEWVNEYRSPMIKREKDFVSLAKFDKFICSKY